MSGTFRLAAASAVGVLSLLVWMPSAHAQTPAASSPAPAVIHGVVTDQAGDPVAGAMVSAIGEVTMFAVADRRGRFEIAVAVPGAYLVRAHRQGFETSRGRIVDLAAGSRVSSTLALRRADPQVLAAGVGLLGAFETEERTGEQTPGTAGDAAAPADRGETAWRIRHARRGILKDADRGAIADEAGDVLDPVDAIGRAVGTPARMATSFFADTPFTGQVNLLTTSSFETPQQLFSGSNISRGTAYVRLGAPVGTQGDWTVRGAITEADLTAWLVAGSYQTRVPARHAYEFGMSYATQRYDGGNPLARRDVADGTRNVGTLYALDTFTVTPAFAVTYGGRYAQYDYLEHRSLISPRFAVAVSPVEGLRVNAVVSRRAHAPGAEEFLPPGDTGIWLPPQRTFSSLEAGRLLDAERTLHVAVEVERDLGAATIGLRAFRQRVDDQLVTVFGAELPQQPDTRIGHYLIANAGDLLAHGCTASFSTRVGSRLQGSLAYSLAAARMESLDNVRMLLLLAPSAVRSTSDRIHDVATTVQADVPETSTKVLVLYRVSNAFARGSAAGERPIDRPGLDSRFDVQVRQSLPFLDFSSARWEMLVAVRNFFRDPADDQSLYDELLTVRPPKRLVGGVTVHF